MATRRRVATGAPLAVNVAMGWEIGTVDAVVPVLPPVRPDVTLRKPTVNTSDTRVVVSFGRLPSRDETSDNVFYGWDKSLPLFVGPVTLVSMPLVARPRKKTRRSPRPDVAVGSRRYR